MKYTSTVVLSFGAGHKLEIGDHLCGAHNHGHLYAIEVTFDREGYPDKDLVDWTRQRSKTLDLVMELKNRELNKMLGAQVPNVFGVASFFMERLAINEPVNRVEVYEDSNGPVARIERDTDF